jgi:hypothetical protein
MAISGSAQDVGSSAAQKQTGIKKGSLSFLFCQFGAGEESRTLDLNLGKVALYQLSYSRVSSLAF